MWEVSKIMKDIDQVNNKLLFTKTQYTRTTEQHWN